MSVTERSFGSHGSQEGKGGQVRTRVLIYDARHTPCTVPTPSTPTTYGGDGNEGGRERQVSGVLTCLLAPDLGFLWGEGLGRRGRLPPWVFDSPQLVCGRDPTNFDPVRLPLPGRQKPDTTLLVSLERTTHLFLLGSRHDSVPPRSLSDGPDPGPWSGGSGTLVGRGTSTPRRSDTR